MSRRVSSSVCVFTDPERKEVSFFSGNLLFASQSFKGSQSGVYTKGSLGNQSKDVLPGPRHVNETELMLMLCNVCSKGLKVQAYTSFRLFLGLFS